MTELIRSLPKQLRTTFVPVPDTARAVLPRLGPARGDLLDALGTELSRLGGVHIPRSAWDESRLPAYLRITFRVVEDGRVLASGQGPGRAAPPAAAPAAGHAQRGGRPASPGPGCVPGTSARCRGCSARARSAPIRRWPTPASAVDVRLFETRAQADAAMLRGTRRLLLLAGALRGPGRGQPPAGQRQAGHEPPPVPEHRRAARRLRGRRRGPGDHRGGRPGLGRSGLRPAAGGRAGRIWPPAPRTWSRSSPGRSARRTRSRPAWPRRPARRCRAAFADLRAQLAGLVHPGFVAETGARRLPDLVRYLRGMSRRLEKMPEALGRDAERMAVVQRVSRGLPADRWPTCRRPGGMIRTSARCAG